MELIELHTTDAIDPRRWDELWANCPDATVFQSRTWMHAWERTFATSPDSLKLIAAFDGARLVGLATLVRGEPSARVTRREAWLPLADDYSDYHPFLVWGGSQSVVDGLLEGIDRFVPAGESVYLYDVPQFSALGLNLGRRARRDGSGFQAGDWVVCPSLAVRSNSQGVAQVLAKESLHRHERALRRIGELVIEHITDAQAIAPLLPEFFEQHVARRAQTDHPSLFRKPLNRRFYEAVAAAPDSGVLYSVLRLNDRIVAQHFGLRSRDALLWYKPAFDITLRKASPGEVLLKAIVEQAAALNLRELDFTRGAERFKSRFASRVAYNRHFIWHRRTGDRLKAKLVQSVKNAIHRARSTPDEPLLTLRGVAASNADDRRVLLVGADETTAACFSAALTNCSIEVAEATCRGSSNSYSMVVICSSDEPRLATDIRTVLCFALWGQLARVFTVAAIEVADEVIQSARIAVRERDWHGFAIVHVRVSEGSRPEVVHVDGKVDRSIAAALRAGVDIPSAMWRAARGEPIGPQLAEPAVRS